MTVTCFGAIADELGHAQWVNERAHSGPGGRLVVEVTNIYGVLRVDQFRSAQPSNIAMDFGSHGAGPCGEVVYLEQEGRYLSAVAVLDHLQPEDLEAAGPLRFSTLTKHPRSGDNVELVSIAVVKAADAATIALPLVRWIPGDVRYGALANIGIGQQPDILKRAKAYTLEHRRRDPLMIRTPDPLGRVEYATSERFGKRLAMVDGQPIGLVDQPPLKLRRPIDVDDQPPRGYGPLETRRPPGVPIQHGPRGRVLRVH